MSQLKFCFLTIAAVICIIFSFSFQLYPQQNSIQSPEEFFGFKPGADRMLFTYEELISYLQKLDESSPRIKLVEIGKTPMGRPMFITFISSEENIAKLSELKSINRELALNPNLNDTEREEYFKNGKVFVLGTLSMHSDEVGPSQASSLIAYEYATTNDPGKLQILSNVVYMMVPCHNPDGMDKVVENYKKYKGTKYEGASLPEVYHKYIGHDNNRDFVSLTQEDTKAIAGIYNKDWFPQVMVEKHQMGSLGPRYFVPPMHDPIAENIDAGIWNWTGIFGSNLMTDMTKAGLKGVSQHYLFDDYWPGSTETAIWKNVIGFLTECASSDYATPVFVEPNELRVYGKGLAEYKKSINMPQPWPGGWWRLGDIVEYEIVSTNSILKTAYLHRDEILKYRNDLCRKEVELGKTEPPYYYILPQEQHDKGAFIKLVNLLNEHGVQCYFLTKSVEINNRNFDEGDIVIPLAQPFRAFIKEVMEKQDYPLRHYTPNGEIIKPYDITSWSLPLHLGVKSIEINEKAEFSAEDLKKIEAPLSIKMKPALEAAAILFTANNNESYKAAFTSLSSGLKVDRLTEPVEIKGEQIPAGSFIINLDVNKRESVEKIIGTLNVDPVYLPNVSGFKTENVKLPRIALVETNFHDMDAGWTRFIFDDYNIPFSVVKPGDFKDTDFAEKFDIVVFPSADKSVLMDGKYKSGERYFIPGYPPEFRKGIGKEGMEKLMTYLDNGGIILSWEKSTGLFLDQLTIKQSEDDKEEFQLPVNDVSENLQKDGLYIPGSLLKVKLAKDHPLTYGMQNEIGVFFRGEPVFSTSLPRFDMDRRVIAVFPEENILLSGYAENVSKLENRTAAVWLKKGKGQFVLFGFNPVFRGSTDGSFKLLFNSLLLNKLNN